MAPGRSRREARLAIGRDRLGLDARIHGPRRPGGRTAHRAGYPRREGCAVSAAVDLASPNAARSCNAMADRPICSAGVNSALFLVREPKTLVDKPSGSMFANQLRASTRVPFCARHSVEIVDA